MERNEKMQENVSSTATADVNSSVRCFSVRLAICKEVITNRQKPKRFAEVVRMCGEVLFAISQKLVLCFVRYLTIELL